MEYKKIGEERKNGEKTGRGKKGRGRGRENEEGKRRKACEKREGETKAG